MDTANSLMQQIVPWRGTIVKWVSASKWTET